MEIKKQERFSPPAVGGASLLVVFAVLCLTVFALLSLSTVRADDRLSRISAQAVADYYAADCKAQEVLARLKNGEEPPKDIKIKEAAGSSGENSVVYSYACPISSTQTLEVEVEFQNAAYEVLRWQAVPTGDWTIDDRLSVWDGES